MENKMEKCILNIKMENKMGKIIDEYQQILNEYTNLLVSESEPEPQNIVQNSILVNAEKRFDSYNDNDCKITLVKYFLSYQIPYNRFKQQMIQNNIKTLIIDAKSGNNSQSNIERNLYRFLNEYKNKINDNNINEKIKIIPHHSRFNKGSDEHKYDKQNLKFYELSIKILRLIQNTSDCNGKKNLLDKIKKDIPFLFNLIYLACINSYFKDLEVLKKLTPSNDNISRASYQDYNVTNNKYNEQRMANKKNSIKKITKKKEKKNIVDGVFILSRTISQLLINKENSNELNKDTINHILQNMKYNIDGLKLKQTNNNNNVYHQTMNKMIELISNLIEDRENKDHLKTQLYSLIFNGNSSQLNPSNKVRQPNPSNIVTQPTQGVQQTESNTERQQTRVQNQTKKKSLFQRFKGLFRRTKKK
jgi:hypothetical protein